MMNHSTASLYVGDLDPSVTEAQLYDVFKTVGQVASIRVCRDFQTKQSLGYAYVNYQTMADAELALDKLNYTPIKGHPCRIMWSIRDPSVRKSGSGNVFIKNLDKSIDQKLLYDTFSQFGNIMSCKIAQDDEGKSKGYGFVHFETGEDAAKAIATVNGKEIEGKIVFVGPFVSVKERREKFTNVYVKSIPKNLSDAEVRALFEPFGTVLSAVVMRDDKGASKGFGFVNFKDPEDAANCCDEMNNKPIGNMESSPIYVGRAQKKPEREKILRYQRAERAQKYQGINLYVKNLDESIDDDKLMEAFAPFGQISSAKVMVNEKGASKGFGFVCFSAPEEAQKAAAEMNSKVLVSKPIYVALAEPRDLRRAKLEMQHNVRNAQRALPPMNAGPGPMYGGGAPIFYSQMPPVAAQRGGFVGYPSNQMAMAPRGPIRGYPGPMPGARGGYPMNMMPQQGGPQQVPAVVPGSPSAGPANAPGGRRPPMGNVPMSANNGGGRRGNGSNGNNNMMRGNGMRGGMRGGKDGRAAGDRAFDEAAERINPATISQLSPDDRRQALGEALFPLIGKSQPAKAAKITGMILDSMNVSEVLQLLNNEDALNAKIQEALDVLDAHPSDAPNDETATH